MEYKSSRIRATQSLRQVLPWCLLGGTDHGRPAVKLADELEAERDMMKADWECWKKIEEQLEQIHGPFLFDSDEDDEDEAHRDKRI